MKTKEKEFENAKELCNFVNNNGVEVVSICADKPSTFWLFYLGVDE